jgi:hypothetical protein
MLALRLGLIQEFRSKSSTRLDNLHLILEKNSPIGEMILSASHVCSFEEKLGRINDAVNSFPPHSRLKLHFNRSRAVLTATNPADPLGKLFLDQ